MADQKLNYRPDIDGLRAVAVLPVVAFHMHLPMVTGGFVGVDVFFVISGYLIGSIILRDCENGTFTFSGFYRRRIARIFPALAAVLLFVLVMCWKLSTPHDFDDASKSLLSALFSVSNFFFWSKEGYFDDSLASAPLLHTWSLSVEEQFYIVFPILVLLLKAKSRLFRSAALISISVLSLLVAGYATFKTPDAAFYLLPFRWWELGIGVILALRLIPIPRSWLVGNLIAAMGLVLVLLPMAAYDSETPFPGFAALVPCIGAAMVIHAGEARHASLVGRLLGWLPVRFIGLISYSMYLWHWPLIAFQNSNGIFFINSFKLSSKLGLLAIIFVVSVASWYFIERPTRRWGALYPKRVIPAGILAGGIVAALAGAVLVEGGFLNRYPQEAARFASYPIDDDSHFRPKECFLIGSDKLSDFDPKTCLSISRDKPNYLLVGDSHAAHLWFGLAHAMPAINFEQATVGGCAPTIDEVGLSKKYCREIMDEVFDQFLQANKPQKIILAARWTPRVLPALK